jgi:hypothetical protein
MQQPIPYIQDWQQYPFAVNRERVHRHPLSAAKSISDLYKVTAPGAVKHEVQAILDAKEKYYCSEAEFVMYTGLLFAFGKEKGDAILEMLDIAVGLFPKSADLAYMYAGAHFFVGNPLRGVTWLEKTIAIKPDHYEATFDLHRAKNFRSPYRVDDGILQSYVGGYGKWSIVLDKDGKALALKTSNGSLFPMLPISDDEFILLEDTEKGYIQFKVQNHQTIALMYRNKRAVTDFLSKDTSPWSLEHKKAIEHPLSIETQVLASYTGEFGAREFLLKAGELYYRRAGQGELKMIPMSEDTFVFKDFKSMRLKMIKENGRVVAVDALYEDGTVKRDARTK